MKLLITLTAARENIGLDIKDAAPLFGVCSRTLSRYENDSSKVPQDFISAIPHVYLYPTKHIFFGKKYEYIRILKEEGIEI